MTPTEEMLMAYADGELTGAERDAVAALVEADPALAARVEAHRALRRKLSAVYAPVAEEETPDRLLALLGAGGAGREPAARPSPAAAPLPGQVVDLAAIRAERARAAKGEAPRQGLGLIRWGAIAAGLVLAVLAARYAMPPQAQIVGRGGALVAQGDLARALDGQLSSRPQPDGVVKVGLSFKDGAGRYCRTFQPAKGEGQAGVACRDARVWTVEMTTHARPTAAGGAYRMAASSTPAPVLEAAQAMMAGDPLDAAAEARAKAKGWR